MFQIAICDDSGYEVGTLNSIISEHLKKFSSNVKITLFHSGLELLKFEGEFNIVFLDIEMEGINGIETAEKLKNRSLHTKIIYVTNYNKYQSDAFQVHAFQYLLKPINSKAVCKVLDEAIRYVLDWNRKNTLSFETNKGQLNVKSSEVYYLEFINRKIKVKTNQDSYLINGSLSSAYDKLRPHGFGMPHKSFIVNYYHVNIIKGYTAELRNGEQIPIAQRKSVNFRGEFEEFLHNTYYLL